MTLPDRWLQGAPNLLNLDLSYNKFETFSSTWFSGPTLETLDLEGNELRNSALNAFATTAPNSITTLRLNNNQLEGDVCTDQAFAPLRNMTRLRRLYIRGSRVHICTTGATASHTCNIWNETVDALLPSDRFLP